MQLKIENIKKRTDVSKVELFRNLKSILGGASIAEICAFIEKTETNHEILIDEEMIPHLRSCFIFKAQTARERENELAYEQYQTKEDANRKAAVAWFNTLTKEQQGYINYLGVGAPQG